MNCKARTNFAYHGAYSYRSTANRKGYRQFHTTSSKAALTHAVLATALGLLSGLMGCSRSEPDTVSITTVALVETGPADMTLENFHGGCSAAGCHQQLGGGATKWVHAPVANNNCAVCHSLVGEPETHEFEPVATDDRSCLECHALEGTGEVVHEPFALGACNDCHNPHGGDSKSFIRNESPGELCLSCHQESVHAVPHPPVEQRDCLACHDPHRSNHEALLIRSQTELCFGCHRDKDFVGLISVYSTETPPEFMHEPMVSEGCSACHFPHGGESPGMLIQDPQTLCLGCHQGTLEGMHEAQTVHKAFLQDDQSCLRCHAPHASDHDGLLSDSPFMLCMSCHDKPIERPSQEPIPNMKAIIEESPVVHAPAANGECSACHAPHFSPQRGMLRVKYPEREYAQFSHQAYAMCLECHDSILIEEPFTPLTGFREGDQNLHFTHINREKGRACDICHQPHAGTLPKLMREEFPFGPGGWSLPIGFALTETGGTCTSACHEQRWYDNTYSQTLPPTDP